MASVRGLRVATAYAVWTLCVLTALFIAGATLLVALRADPEHVLWGTWMTSAEGILAGWVPDPDVASSALREEFGKVIRGGAAAGGVLLVGALMQWLVRPRRA